VPLNPPGKIAGITLRVTDLNLLPDSPTRRGYRRSRQHQLQPIHSPAAAQMVPVRESPRVVGDGAAQQAQRLRLTRPRLFRMTTGSRLAIP
jgi:hypothetical protein